MMKNKVLVLSCVLALVFCLGAVSLAGAAEKEPVVGQVGRGREIQGARNRRDGFTIWAWPRPHPFL